MAALESKQQKLYRATLITAVLLSCFLQLLAISGSFWMANLSRTSVNRLAETALNIADENTVERQRLVSRLAFANSQSMYSIALCSSGGLLLSMVSVVLLWKRGERW